jgi:hypothetical protein
VTLRRRRLPEELRAPARAFDDLVPALERAKAALTDAVPGTRLPGRPLAEALWAFETGLREVQQGMDAWRATEVETEWLGPRPVSSRPSGWPSACAQGTQSHGGSRS